jgi:zinc protease
MPVPRLYLAWLPAVVALLCLCTRPLSAGDIVDLTSHTNLRGAWLIEQPDAVELDVRLLIEAGEYDNTGLEGLAHYLEHLVFLSADKIHGDFGDRTANAWTSRNWTLYWNNGPVANLEPMFDNAARIFSPVDLDRNFAQSEVDIVEREFDLRNTESPWLQLYTKMYQSMYAGHPFARSVIGSRDSIRQFTPQATAEFHRQWYRASNAYLLVSGPLRADQIIPQLKKRFAALPAGSTPPHQWSRQSRQPDSINIEMTHPTIGGSRVLYIRHAAALDGMSSRQQLATCALTTELLNSAQPGGLTKPLYYDEFLTLELESNCDIQPDRSNLLLIWAQPEEGVTAEKLFAQFDQTLPTLTSHEAFDKSIETVRQRLIKTLQRLAREPQQETNIATLGLLLHNDILSSDEYIDDIRSVQTRDIKRLLSAFAQSATKARGQIHPETGQ